MATTLGGFVTERGEEPCVVSGTRDPWLVHCVRIIETVGKERDLTLKALGEAVGLSDSHMSHIVTSTAIPRLLTLFEILRYLEIKPGFPFEPRVPSELASTVELLLRASPPAQKLARDMLLLFDQETIAAQQGGTPQDQCA